ncbi:hypothetical protein JHK87_027854 [Glycine soja]|nr:hypothetical protein JHK87_027854 [Glycine soja]
MTPVAASISLSLPPHAPAAMPRSTRRATSLSPRKCEKCLETGETLAIKKVLQDELVTLKHCFFSTTKKDEIYLNLVLEYVLKTAH